MQTIDDFLKDDIVSFLNVLDKNSEKNVASVDETNELLKENFNKVSNNSNNVSNSQNLISPATNIKTVNVYQTISPQNINPSIPIPSSDHVVSSSDKRSSSSSLSSSDSSVLNSKSADSSKVVSSNNFSSKDDGSFSSDHAVSSSDKLSSSSSLSSSDSSVLNSKSADSSKLVSSNNFSSKDDGSFSSPSSAVSVPVSLSSSDSSVLNSKSEDSLKLSSNDQDFLVKANDLDIYVKAIIALHKRDFVISIKYLSFLLSKNSNNVIYKSRLQDALLSKAKLDNKSHRHTHKKEIKHKHSSSNLSSLNNYLKKSKDVNLSSIQFDKYVKALHELKNNNKDVALELLSELSKENPNNFSIKLHLKEAQELLKC